MSDTNIGILSDITVFTKYARYKPELKRRETWSELANRNRDMHIKKYPALTQEINNLYDNFVIPKKVLPSMRSLQFGGKPIEVAPSRLFNCSYLPIDDYRAFSELMFLLLGGTGVGYSVQKHHIEKLPEIRKPIKTRRFLVGDSIEGWSDAIKALMKSYMKGAPEPRFDFSDIRPKGAALITSGGKAPGPEPLKDCLHNLKKILDRKSNGDKLTTLEVHDMACFIADAVLAGGIRRAALISLFSLDDESMLTCKFGNWWELNPQRGRANNSAVVVRHRIKEPKFMELWSKIKASGSGEPGIYFTNNPEFGTNPCCFTGDTKLLTSEGYVSFSELSGKEDIELVNYRGEIHSGSVWSTGVKSTVLIKFDDGLAHRCTPDHRFMLSDGSECQAKDLVGKQVKTLTQSPLDTYPTVLSVEDAGECEVFDFNLQDDTHWGVIEGGFIAHNCEIALRPFQMCNLTEINVSDVDSQEELEARARAASFLGTLQAGYTDFHYLRDIWKRTCEKDALLGVSMTGICSGNVLKLDMKAAAKVVRAENKRVAKEIGIKPAARTTCVKPAGTTSLVLGCSSGIHAWHSPYYIRRMRLGKNEAIYKYLAKNHPSLLEDDFFTPNTQSIVSVPVKAPDGAIFRDEPALEMLERIKRVSSDWVATGHRSGDNTHNVSATVSLRDDEWEAAGEWMWDNRDSYSGLSVLPYDGGTYKQAPFEDIDEETYNRLSANLAGVDLTQVIEDADETDLSGELACAGGSCELK